MFVSGVRGKYALITTLENNGGSELTGDDLIPTETT